MTHEQKMQKVEEMRNNAKNHDLKNQKIVELSKVDL